MTRFSILNFLLLFAQFAQSVIIKHDFNITWIWASPDGVVARPVIGINNEWPLPQINATVGDTLIINVLNSLGNQSTSLHFHGLFMNGTAHMDGTSYVSQCAIPPGSKFTYEFTVQQPGTYWYHSHTKSQYPDGLRGLLVVKDPESPYSNQYDEEIVLSVSDWYHNQTADLIEQYDMRGRDPPPDANLINDMASPKIRVQPNKTYLVRLVNIGAFVGQYFWIEGHVMRIVEVDGVYTQPAEAATVYLATGQRYSFLLTTKTDSTANYPLVSRADNTLFSIRGDKTEIEASGWLVYDDKQSFPDPLDIKDLESFDDMTLVPFDQQPLLDHVDQNISIVIDMTMGKSGTHWMFNKTPYTPPTIPTLFTLLTSSPQNTTSPSLYTTTVSPIILPHNQIIEIAIKNKHMKNHPLHLHGHNFQVIERSPSPLAKDYNSAGGTKNPAPVPLRRDTILVNSGGTATIRFRADNPGVWLFHCHMEWHAHSGLVSTIIEAPTVLQTQPLLSTLRLRPDPQRVCAEDQVPQTSASLWKSLSHDWSIISLTLIIALPLLTLALLTYLALHLYRHSQRTQESQSQNQAYTLVPLKEDGVEVEIEDVEDVVVVSEADGEDESETARLVTSFDGASN